MIMIIIICCSHLPHCVAVAIIVAPSVFILRMSRQMAIDISLLQQASKKSSADVDVNRSFSVMSASIWLQPVQFSVRCIRLSGLE